MNAHAITPRQLRRMLGVRSRTTVVRYINGERLPASDVMERILELTAGAVTMEDFLDPSPALCARVVQDRFGRAHVVYPWTDVEHHRTPKAANDDARPVLRSSQRADHSIVIPPMKPASLPSAEDIDRWPSRPLQRALDVLGSRVIVTKRGGFLLHGRQVDARRVVREANRVLASRDLPPIPYPGVEPLE